MAAVAQLARPTARFFWDADRRVARAYGRRLGPFPERPDGEVDVLWDAYLLFDANARFSLDDPTLPTYWMHQLWGVPDSVAPQLVPSRLKEEAGRMLGPAGPR